jgi:tetratricopeptide (TPR) repeat protein
MSLAIVAILLCAPANKDPDLDLAAALARRGWVELAEELCARIERNPSSSPAAREGVPMVLAEVAIAKARVEADIFKATKELEIAVDRLNRPNHALTLDERGMVGWLHVQKAKILSGAAQDDVARRPEAIRSWDTVISYYRAALGEYQKAPSGRAVSEAILDATMELAKGLASQARVPSVDPTLREKLLKESIGAFSDLMLTIGTSPILLEALLEEGRSRADLKDYVRAERCFREMPRMKIALRRMSYPPSEYQTVLLNQGVLALAGTLMAAQKPKEAIAVCDEFLGENPRMARLTIGIAVTLAKAEAVYASGDRNAAVALARGVLAMDPDGPAGEAARAKLAVWTKDLPVTPAGAMTTADGFWDRGKYREALTELRRVVESCRTDAERSAFEPVAAYKRGECFRLLKQDPEAAVAYREVFRKYPKHELAPRAALEAVRALSRASTGDHREEDQMEKLLDEVETLDLRVDVRSIVRFLRAEILERKGQLKAAADLFRLVDENCPVYDEALVAGSHDYRRDAEQKWDKARGTPALRDDLAKQLALAESMARKALPRLEEAGRERARILASAYYELAAIGLHESVGKPADALGFLKKCAGLLPPESDLRPRLSELEIQAHILSKDLEAAAIALDRMIRVFPDSSATARSCRRLAQRFDASDPARAAKYYSAWLDRMATVPFTTSELKLAAEGLHQAARSVNGFGDGVASVLDLRGKALLNRAIWTEALRAYEMLAQAKDLSADDATLAARNLVWCAGFQAVAPEDWTKSKTACEKLLEDQGLLKSGVFTPAVLTNKRWLLGMYLDYGHSLYQLGKSGQKFQYGNALTVFNEVIKVTGEESEPWWIAQYMGLRCLFEHGEGSDIRTASGAFSLLEKNRVGFDGGKFGLKDRFVELGAEIRKAEGTPR